MAIIALDPLPLAAAPVSSAAKQAAAETQVSTTREMRLEPGHDCIRFECKHGSPRCVPGGGGSHGVHGITLRMVVRGDGGAVQFVAYLSDLLPGSVGHMGRRAREFDSAMAVDLGYHSKVQRYDDQGCMDDCEWIADGKCYYDGSGLDAEPVLDLLLERGSEGVYEYLERYYCHVFDGAAWPEPPATELVARGQVPR